MNDANLIKRMAISIWRKRNLDEINKWYALDLITHVDKNQTTRSLSEFSKGLSLVFSGFSSTDLIIEQQVSQNDVVASRVTFIGKHTGDFMGLQPSGKDFAISGCRFDKVKDGKIVEHWPLFDFLSLVQQIST